MKIVTLNLQTKHELDFQNKDIVHMVEDNELRKVWERMVQAIKLEKETNFELEDKVMADAKRIIEEYQKNRTKKEIELEGEYTYIYVNQEQNIYTFSSFCKTFKIEIDVKTIKLVQEEGTIKMFKVEG